VSRGPLPEHSPLIDNSARLTGESNEDESSFRIQSPVGPSTGTAAVVATVSQAVDEVFAAHSRADRR
jgi:hypothetical protein